MASFDLAIGLLMDIEGRTYTNDPDDAGGPTKFGVTLASLREWRENPSLQAHDVQALTEPEAHDFYLEMYWQPLLLDLVQSQHMAYVILDQAVNRGSGTVVRGLQAVLNQYGFQLLVDGVLGPKTLTAINGTGFEHLIIYYIIDSENKYADIVVGKPAQLKYLRSWLNRTHALLKLVLA